MAHFEILSAHPPIGVILTAATFRRSEEPALSEVEGISRLTGPARTPNCTTLKFKTLGNSKPWSCPKLALNHFSF